MKIFISVDIEGVAAVVHRDQTKLEGIDYETARRWMTAEANAAIEGAFAAGATEIVVADSHGHMRNLQPELLHPDVLLVSGSPRALSMMEGIDDSFSAAFFIGYHAMAGNALGILAHTYLGISIYSVRLNGIEVGESGINAAIAGHYGIPVVLVSGDDMLAAEIASLLPWSERVITKWALSTIAAKNLSPQRAQTQIRLAAQRALERLPTMQPLTLDAPLHLEVEFIRPIHAQVVADIPGVEWLTGRKVTYTAATMLELSRVWRLMLNLSLGDRFV
ncbi:MAG: M55 family metallopeptidase [Caldilineaceae bacterium]|nr:M55 family metallopeptidase [Caldilineaceae bacterium]